MSILTKEDIWAKYQLSVYRQLQRLIATQSTNIGDVISTDGQNLIWSVGGGGGTWGSITGTLSAQTDLQNALNAKEDTANKAVAGGYASLDGTGKVPAGQLPSYVDDVIEYADFVSLPVTGSTGLIYVTIDNNKTYRWTGSAYTEISANTPAGSNTEIQFNNSGAFGASPNLTWSGTALTVPSIIGSAAVSGTLTLSSTSNATKGKVLFGTSAYDEVNNRLGIGTTGPVEKLDVAGNIQISNGGYLKGATYSASKVTIGDDVVIGANSHVILIPTSLKSVGIGNIVPTGAKLVVTDTALAGSAALSGGVLELNQTWNTTGAPTAIKLNITNTASNVSSLLMDLQVGGTSKFKISNSALTLQSANIFLSTGQSLFFNQSGFISSGRNSAGTGITIDNSVFGNPTITSGTFNALTLSQGYTPSGAGSGVYRQLNIAYSLDGTAGVQSGTATGIFLNATETALNGMTHNLMDLQVGGVSKFSVSSAGAVAANSVVAVSSVTAGVGSFLRWGGSSIMTAPSDGVIKMSNAALSDFSRLQFGGTTSSFPSLKRSTTGIIVRLADDSADTDITAAKVISTDVVRLKGYTVATLPGSPTQGDTVFCTDLTTPTYMAVAVGGGAVVGKVFWNGTNWIT